MYTHTNMVNKVKKRQKEAQERYQNYFEKEKQIFFLKAKGFFLKAKDIYKDLSGEEKEKKAPISSGSK